MCALIQMSSSDNLSRLSENDVKGNGVETVVLKPCHVCGRTFNPHSLERHEKVCEKQKKCIRRNVFNSFSQRAKELAAIPVLEVKDEEKKKCKKSKEEQGNSLRVGRGDKHGNLDVLNNGSSQNKKLPAGYQQCPSCCRCFNEKAAERHIAWCTEQQSRLPKTPPNSEALERLKARIKYKAPLPKRIMNHDSNIRLVKSAESVREPSILRTHSSPFIPVHSLRRAKENNESLNDPDFKSRTQKKIDRNMSLSTSNINDHGKTCNAGEETHNKKAVKFKDIFPVYKKERNKNLDMLAALRLRLSELETSDDFTDDCFMKQNENEMLSNQLKRNLPTAAPTSREIWTSDGEAHCSTSSSSDGSLPSLSHIGNSEPRMPRFCYNCGTKYPIVSAKFCCECGARRFVFGANNNQLYAM